MSSPFSNNNQHGQSSSSRPNASIQHESFLLPTSQRRRGRPPTARPCQYCHSIKQSYQNLMNHIRHCEQNPNNRTQRDEGDQDVNMVDVVVQDSTQRHDISEPIYMTDMLSERQHDVNAAETSQYDYPEYADDGMDISMNGVANTLTEYSIKNSGSNVQATTNTLAENGMFQTASA